jgi:tetratricopeptide (TPR) repeat protein
MAASGRQHLIRLGWACALVASVSCVHPTPSVTPLPGSFPRDHHRAELLSADTVRQALVRIVTHCEGQKWVGTGYVVAEDRFGLSREVFVMTARHVVMPKLCENKKKRVDLSGPSIVTQTIDDELDKHLVFSEKGSTAAAEAAGLDVAVLKVVARETITKLPLDELPPPNAGGRAHIWGFPERSGSSEATYREGKISIGSRQAGDLRYETDALLHSDQGMSGGPVLWQQHGLVAALVSGREDLASGVSDRPYVLLPMSTVLDRLPESLRRRLGVLPRLSQSFLEPTLPQTYVARPEKEEAVLDRLLAHRNGQRAPLWVLHGGPGVGKTTLAKRVSQRLRIEHRRQVLWIEASKKDPSDVLLELLTALTGERPQFPTEPTAASGDRKPQLPMEERLAPLLRAALADAPQLVVALNDAHWPQLPKWLFDALERTPTLLTAWRALPEADSVELGVLLPAECHALFLEHRKKKHAAATADDANKVCVALGNHPLAVELAANVLGAKRQTWSESDLFSALQRARLPVLAGGSSDPSRTIPVIAEALLATIPEPQRGDARLATLALGQLGDAPVPRSLLVRVLGGSSILGERADSAIEQLTDAGLLDPDGPPNAKRLRLHTLLWEWAKTLSEAPEQAMYVSKVRDRLLEVLRQHDTKFTEAFLAHLVQAQENAEKAERWPLVIEYAKSLADELLRLGHWKTVRTLLSRASAAAESSGRRDEKAWVLNAMGSVAWSQGDYGAARMYFHDSRAIAEDLADYSGIASALNNLGNVAASQGDHATARTYFQDSLARKKESGDRLGIANSLNNLGNVAYVQRDYAAARMYYQDSLALKKQLGHRSGIASSLGNLGNVALSQGDYAAARTYFQASLNLSKELGARLGVATSLNNLGNVAYEQGNYAAARTYFQASLNLSKELGDRLGVATSLNNLGHVAYAQGDYATARTFFQDNLALNKELGHRSGIATTLMNLGSVAEKDGSGDLDAALKYFEQAQQLATSLNANNSVLGKALWGLGRVAAKREMKTEARQYLDQAIQIFQQMGDPVLQEAQRFRDSLRSAPDPGQ